MQAALVKRRLTSYMHINYTVYLVNREVGGAPVQPGNRINSLLPTLDLSFAVFRSR